MFFHGDDDESTPPLTPQWQ